MMKDKLELYSKKGIYIDSGEIEKQEIEIAITNCYYLSFYVDASLRDIKCVLDDKFFQIDLYGDDSLEKRVQYKHHHLNSFFNNLALVNQYLEEYENRAFTKSVFKHKFDEMPRHKIQHFNDDCKKTFRKKQFIIHGLNVIFDENDLYLRSAKNINRLLDLIENKYYYYIPNNPNEPMLKVFDLNEVKNKLESLQNEIKVVRLFINRNWESWI